MGQSAETKLLCRKILSPPSWATILFFCLFIQISTRSTLAGGNADNGETISRQHCMRCHVVSEDNPFAGIGSTPSFMLLVNALRDWEDRFRTFYTRRPHPVHVRIKGLEPLTNLPSNAAIIDLRLEDVEDILTYARSLKKE